MASESAHWESAAHDHELHAFQAFRSMDEILLADYMLFNDVVRETPYDLWIGDESWEVDQFLHENPDRKIAPYVFTTDVVGFMPTDPDDPREAEVCADYNAEQIEHRERFPYVRDLSLFIGATEELPDTTFGADLPGHPRVYQPLVRQRPLHRAVRPGIPGRPRRPPGQARVRRGRAARRRHRRRNRCRP
jgi:hypothetical protein